MAHTSDPGQAPSPPADEPLLLKVDTTFAMTPTWVLEADISDRAKVLYAMLRRYGDVATHSYPKRSTLAAKLRVQSLRTVDAAIDELVGIGALEVVARHDSTGNRLSNGYIVRSLPYGKDPRTTLQGSSRPQDAAAPGPVQPAAHQERDKDSSQASLERSAQRNRTQIPDGGSPVPALVGHYVDQWKAANGGRTPPSSTLARLGKGIKELTTSGDWQHDEIRAGLTRLVDRNIDVGLLASTVMQVVAQHRDRSAIAPATVATDTSTWSKAQCDAVLGPDTRTLRVPLCEHDIEQPEPRAQHEAQCVTPARAARLLERQAEAAEHLARQPVSA